MGIEDRDYYRDKHKQLSEHGGRGSFHPATNRRMPYRHPGKPSNGGFRYLLYPAFVIAALWFGADALLKYQAAVPVMTPLPAPDAPVEESIREAPPQQPETNHASHESVGVIIKADSQGHFRGTALVNGVAMPFLIDTGATKTVIPAKFAVPAKLPYGRYVQASTAGGKVSERETRLNSLKIGNAEIRNLDAHLNDHLDEVLIGMNTLKYFRMTQDGNKLTLVAGNQAINREQNAQASVFETTPAESEKKPVSIKKTVVCDERKVCKTTYSNR